MWAFARTGVTHFFVFVLVWEQICSKPKHFFYLSVYFDEKQYFLHYGFVSSGVKNNLRL